MNQSFDGPMNAQQSHSIFFVSAHEATNILNWSGTLNSLYQSLKTQDPSKTVYAINGSWVTILAKQLNRVLFRLGFKFDCQLTTPFALVVGALTSLRLAFLPPGPVVLAAASNYGPFLFTRRQVVYITDAPFRTAAKIYPELKAMPKWLYAQCDRHEALSLEKAEFVLLPSKWAVDSAKSDYGISDEKIYRLPFGANINDELIERFYVPKNIGQGRVNFLFVSADWDRKGGDKAIAICEELTRLGIDARLTIIGRAPSRVSSFSFVETKGFLRKSDTRELIEICKVYQESHFFLLPTTADASPIVFAEAQAFGVPPITHDVGGTSSSIEHQKTGLIFEPNASAEQFAIEIARYIRQPTLYEELSRGSRRWYTESAQWTKWSELIFKLCDFLPGAP